MKYRLYVLCLGFGLAVLSSGCVTTAVGVGAGVGVGTYSYIKGDLQATYTLQIERLWPKAVQAMDILKLTIDSQHMDSLGGEIKARRADGTPVMVWLKPVGERSTTIGVRVGFFGNREQSERIHNTIHSQLGG